MNPSIAMRVEKSDEIKSASIVGHSDDVLSLFNEIDKKTQSFKIQVSCRLLLMSHDSVESFTFYNVRKFLLMATTFNMVSTRERER